VQAVQAVGKFLEGSEMSGQNNVIFREVQRFSLWIRLFFIASMTLGVAVMLFSSVTAGSTGSPSAIVIRGGLSLLLLGLAALFFVLKLETEVRRDGLYVRFFPLHIHHKKIAPGQLVDCYARRYRPIMEYGGWGIRCGFRGGRAYNVRGNKGVQLVLQDDKRLLVGSQKADELAGAISSMMGMRGR
jgi:hypothetical protein